MLTKWFDICKTIFSFLLFCLFLYLFFRLDDLDSRVSSPSDAGGRTCGFNIETMGATRHARDTKTSPSFKKGMIKGSEGLKSIGRSLRFGVSRAVFPEDLKVSDKKIFDPQDKFLLLWNKLFVVSCILAVFVDPLFFYLPVLNDSSNCLGIDNKLAITATTLRTLVDAFYLIHIALQFRTANIAPSSRVFGRGELVIDPAQIAKRYLKRIFIVDFLSVLPLPQVWGSRYPNKIWTINCLDCHLLLPSSLATSGLSFVLFFLKLVLLI